MDRRKLLFLMLALCLLAGCAAGPESISQPGHSLEPKPETGPASFPSGQESSATPPDLPESIAQPGGSPGPKPATDPASSPSGQGGTSLFAVRPDTGEKELLLENRHWNGLDREAVSPSGNHVLTASRMGGVNGGWQVLLSLYDIPDNRLFNLVPPPCELGGKDSFHGTGSFRFWDEDTLFYDYVFPPEEGETAVRLLFYQIREDGSLSPQVIRLDAPPLAESYQNFGRFPNARYLKEQRILLFPAKTAEGREWLAWDLKDGCSLGRSPADNAPKDAANTGVLRNGFLYGIAEDPDRLTFDLWAYEIATDTMEILGTGPLILSDPQQTEPSMGWLRPIHIVEVRNGPVFRLQAGWSQDPEGYWEALWDRDGGEPIQFAQYPPEPAGDVTALATLPDGRLLVLEPS